MWLIRILFLLLLGCFWLTGWCWNWSRSFRLHCTIISIWWIISDVRVGWWAFKCIGLQGSKIKSSNYNRYLIFGIIFWWRNKLRDFFVWKIDNFRLFIAFHFLCHAQQFPITSRLQYRRKKQFKMAKTVINHNSGNKFSFRCTFPA